jgi:outer membrane protein assembly factor BamB
VKNHLFVASPLVDPYLWQVGANSGAPLKTKQTSNGFANAPTVANGVVYGAHGNILAAYNAASGHTLWSAQINGSPSMSPVVAHGVLYAAAGSIYAYGPSD